MKDFGRKLENLLKLRRISQEKAGRAIGLSQQTIYKWIKMESIPKLDKIGELAAFLGCPIDYFYDDSITELPDENDMIIRRFVEEMGKSEVVRCLMTSRAVPLKSDQPSYKEVKDAGREKGPRKGKGAS